uniref:Protein ENL-like n=1 Tax=Nicotiana sylvestris TaxID=4096 RepID=A0A1U7YG62_NICSY|nr:PREDICTED: protein ENL-like [Nicotiana sylvestris]
MTNPQDNPGTPPPSTPSNSSTPPPPSTSPKPRLKRVKIFARKTIASGALRKKLNEKLKASQAQDYDSNSDSKSYKSASEGEGFGSSDSEKTQNSPSKVISSISENLETRFVLVGSIKDVELPELRRSGVVDHSPTADLHVPALCGVEQERVEESGKKSGGSGSGEAAEGLVNLSTQGDEPSSSTKETLTNLLKKVGASYYPKKQRTPTPKDPSVPKPSKKRKSPSPTTTEFSLPKGRATRSRVK